MFLLHILKLSFGFQSLPNLFKLRVRKDIEGQLTVWVNFAAWMRFGGLHLLNLIFCRPIHPRQEVFQDYFQLFFIDLRQHCERKQTELQ